MRRIVYVSVGIAAITAMGCGSRPDYWNESPKPLPPVGLQSSVGVVDESLNMLETLTFDSSLTLHASRTHTGENVRSVLASPSGDRLFVLSAGVTPRRKPDDERPALWMYDGTGSGKLLAKYPLADALRGLAIDPEGKYAVIYATGDSDTFVQNPNELIIIDTTKPPSATNPQPRTIRSFGGRPQRLTFTPKLQLPAGDRRLLIVETDRDLSIIDLDHLDRKELTVKLSDKRSLAPAGVVYTDGSPDSSEDARLAVRTTSESSVYMLQFVPQTSDKADNDFTVLINVVAVGGTPTDFEFVNTDAGLKLAVLLPSRRKAVLADPATTVTTDVDMPDGYGALDVITSQVEGAPENGSDVALLWGGAAKSASGVAFWSLGKSVGQAYRSIEQLPNVATSVESVVSVPAPHESLKILVPHRSQSKQRFEVLDLRARTASPLFASATNVGMEISRDGQRAWFYQYSDTKIAVVDLNTLHPQSFTLERPITRLFDIATTDGGRAIVAIHSSGAMGATVMDAKAADPATSKAFVGLLQGGL